MGEPGDRAAGPGAQPVRVDNIKEKSWMKSDGADPIQGQIFFATDVATLSPEDEALIDDVGKKVAADMLLNPQSKYAFVLAGYADHRAGDSYNKELSQQRSEAVETRLRSHLFHSPNYECDRQAHGIDEKDPRTSADSATLGIYRRVNVLGPRLLGKPPPPPPPPPPKAPTPIRSKRFKARMKATGSVSYGPYAGERFFMDIVDLTNKRQQEFVYKGLGFGKSRRGFGYSHSPKPSEWVEFSTSIDVELWEFEGFAAHSAVQSKTPILSFTGDMVTLTMAHSRRNPDTVYLKFKNWTVLGGGGASLSGSQTIGTLEPADGSAPMPWSEKDP